MMATSPDRSRELLLAAGAALMVVCGGILVALAPSGFGGDVGSGPRTWVRLCAGGSTLAALLAFSGLLFGRFGTPGRPLLALATLVGVLTALGVVLGGLFLVTDDAAPAADVTFLGVVSAVPAFFAVMWSQGWLLGRPPPGRSPRR